MNKKSILAWCMADWAGSPWPVVIKTFVFSTYFSSVFMSGEKGTILWCNMLTLAGIFIAITSPFIGILVDQKSSERFWFITYTSLLVIICASLWFVHPSIMGVYGSLILLGVGTIIYELACVFYNCILTRIAPTAYTGRISGWGRGVGFLGGLACLIVALKVFIEPDSPPFMLNKELSEHIRALGPFLSLWVLAFSLPAFFLIPKSSALPSTQAPLKKRFQDALTHYFSLFQFLKKRKSLSQFLFCQMLYMDGINTLFATAGIYAMHLFNLDMKEILMFAILCNLSAALGAICFSWVDDWIGSKALIQLSLSLFLFFGIGILLAKSKITFYFFAFCTSLFLGPIQSASRCYLLHISEKTEINTNMGLSALSGKITAFLGPMLMGYLTAVSGSERVGMSSLMVFFIVPLCLSFYMDRKVAKAQKVNAITRTI